MAGSMNRDRYDLIHCILHNLAITPLNNRELMYKCKLSYAQSRSATAEVFSLKLITTFDVADQKSQHYRITIKGLEMLKILDELNEMVGQKIISETPI